MSTVETYSSLPALKAGTASGAACLVGASGVPSGTFFFEAGDFTGRADDLNIVAANSTALSNGAWVRQGASDIALASPVGGDPIRSVDSKLREGALSVFDFMTPAEVADVRARSKTIEVTDALNACFAVARAQGKRRSVYLPDGDYLVGNLEFDVEEAGAQFHTPLALFGDSRSGPVLVAKPGLTGTVLRSRSCVGVLFANFSIDATASAAMAWDAGYLASTAPSAQNWIANIRVDGGSAPTAVNFKYLNDSYPDGLVVNVTDPSQCCIDMTQPGGLAKIMNSIWYGGFLRFGCQNGAIENSWGFGIEWAEGALNHVKVDGCYLYPNAAYDAVEWSQSYETYQGVKGLVHISTQLISKYQDVIVSAYLDVNAFSKLDFHGCQFIGDLEIPVDLFGPNTVNHAASDVLVHLNGGTQTGPLVLNEPDKFAVIATGFMDEVPAIAVTKYRGGSFDPKVSGAATAGDGTYAIQKGHWHREGNRLFFDIRLSWTAHNGTGALTVVNLPFYTISGDVSVSIGYAGNTFSGVPAYATIGVNTINFFNANGAPLNMAAAGDLILSGNYAVPS